MNNRNRSSKLSSRLAPLYAAAFFHGFVFFYAVEKLFMRSIGFNIASVGVMIAFYSTIMLLAETPSGILADRWSRKGVLILASLSLLACIIIGALSKNTTTYLIATGFWGIFFAFYSGTYDSVIYDVVNEETGSSQLYEKFLGRVKTADSLALVLGSLVGGIIANTFDIRYVYYLTIPSTLLSIVALIMFKEPKLHKSDIAVSLTNHVHNTFTAVIKHKDLRTVLAVLVSVSACNYLILEFGQLWYIALATPVLLFGPFNAVTLSSFGIGGLLVSKIQFNNRKFLVGFLAMLLLATMGLILSRTYYFTLVCIALMILCFMMTNIAFTKILHDKLPSNLRAGASSAVSTLGRIVIVPMSLFFGYFSNATSIFNASWILLVLVVIAIVFVIKTYYNKSLSQNLSHVEPVFLDEFMK